MMTRQPRFRRGDWQWTTPTASYSLRGVTTDLEIERDGWALIAHYRTTRGHLGFSGGVVACGQTLNDLYLATSRLGLPALSRLA